MNDVLDYKKVNELFISGSAQTIYAFVVNRSKNHQFVRNTNTWAQMGQQITAAVIEAVVSKRETTGELFDLQTIISALALDSLIPMSSDKTLPLDTLRKIHTYLLGVKGLHREGGTYHPAALSYEQNGYRIIHAVDALTHIHHEYMLSALADSLYVPLVTPKNPDANLMKDADEGEGEEMVLADAPSEEARSS